VSDPEVLKALIAGLAAVMVAIVGLLGAMVPIMVKTRNHARRADVQVTNNHDTNLREEADVRHWENTTTLASLSRQLDTVAGDVRGLRRDVGRLWTADVDKAQRLTELEQTQPRGPHHGETRRTRARADDFTDPAPWAPRTY
jgi:hypothetical protein